MSISSVSSTTSSTFSEVGSDSSVKALEKQKASLESELQQVNSSKMDSKTKQEKVTELQTEIQQLDAEIQEKQSPKVSTNQAASGKANTGKITDAGSRDKITDSNDTGNIIDALA
jgi:predicted RNase H-like nuclease (RuvC/YqgF family)